MAQVDLVEIPEVLLEAFRAGDPEWESKLRERENLGILARILRLIGTEAYQALPDYLAPEVTFELIAPAGFEWVRHARGVREVGEAIASNFRAVRQQRAEILALVGQGDTIMLVGHENGQRVATGEEYEVLTTQQLTFEGGRLVRFRSVVGSLR
jgi:ketosteroid isomerase-like protein